MANEVRVIMNGLRARIPVSPLPLPRDDYTSFDHCEHSMGYLAAIVPFLAIFEIA